MVAAKYNVLRKAILDHMLGVAAFAMPTAVKLRLFTVSPTAAGGGTAVVGNGYADVQIPFDGSIFAAASSTGVAQNGTVVNFGFASGGSWGSIVAVDIRRASDNQLLWFSAFDVPVVVNDGSGFAFNTGDLVFTES